MFFFEDIKEILFTRLEVQSIVLDNRYVVISSGALMMW